MRGLGNTVVYGANRVPLPPARIIALNLDELTAIVPIVAWVTYKA